MFTKNSNITIKRDIDEEINLYSRCIDCGAIYKTILLYYLK